MWGCGVLVVSIEATEHQVGGENMPHKVREWVVCMGGEDGDTQDGDTHIQPCDCKTSLLKHTFPYCYIFFFFFYRPDPDFCTHPCAAD